MGNAPKQLSDVTLVVLGHGSTSAPDAATAVFAHADTIKKRHSFAAVHPAFLRQLPLARDVIEPLSGEIVIVPHLAADGYIAKDVVPRELDLDGGLTERQGKRLYYTEPVGTHPGLADIAAAAIEDVLKHNALTPDRTAVVVVGHGTERDPASGEATRRLADAIFGRHAVAESVATLLEISPLVDDWRTLTSATAVIILPFLFSAGFHGRDDIPARLGLPPIHAIDGPAAGPFEIADRTLYLCPPVGTLPAVADVIVARAQQAIV